MLDDQTIEKLGGEYGKSPAQVVLRWHIQLGNIVFPKSVTSARIRENVDAFAFGISEDNLATIAGLDNDPHGVPSRPSLVGLPYWSP